MEIGEEKEIADEGKMPGDAGRSFEREYPGYAYVHLGQRFEEPPSHYFPLEIEDVKDVHVIEREQKEDMPVFSTSFFKEEDQKYSDPVEEPEEAIGKSTWEYRNPSSFKKISQKIKFLFAFLRRTFIPQYLSFGIPKFSYAYLILAGVLLTGFGTLSFAMKGMNLQGSVLGISNRGVDGALFGG